MRKKFGEKNTSFGGSQEKTRDGVSMRGDTSGLEDVDQYDGFRPGPGSEITVSLPERKFPKFVERRKKRGFQFPDNWAKQDHPKEENPDPDKVDSAEGLSDLEENKNTQEGQARDDTLDLPEEKKEGSDDSHQGKGDQQIGEKGLSPEAEDDSDEKKKTKKREAKPLEASSSSVLLELIATGEDWAIAGNLEHYMNLSSGVGESLVDSGQDWAVAKNLRSFQAPTSSLADKLIDLGHIWAVVENLDRFEGVDHQGLAQTLIGSDEEWLVAKNLDKFHGLTQSVAEKLIESGKGLSVVENLESFAGLELQEMVKKFIAFGYGGAIAQHFDKFQGTVLPGMDDDDTVGLSS